MGAALHNIADIEELAELWYPWAAGIIDGEGCIHTASNGTVTIQITNTDRKMLDRFAQIFDNRRTTRGPYEHDNPNHKAHFTLSYGAQEDVEDVLFQILPWLTTKRNQAEDALYAIDQKRTR